MIILFFLSVKWLVWHSLLFLERNTFRNLQFLLIGSLLLLISVLNLMYLFFFQVALSFEWWWIIIFKGIEIKNFSLHLRILVSIVDYYSLNLYKDELKSLLKPVLVKAIKKLNEVSHLDSYSLIMKLQFIHKIFQVSFTAQTRPSIVLFIS